jgi:sugar phosphate isomerase/epimerase
MLISMATANFYNIPFSKALHIIKKAGFDSIELDGYWHGGDNWETAQHLKNLNPKDIIQMVMDNGLEIASFHDMGGVIEQGIDSVISTCTYEYLKYYDFPCIVFHTPCIRNAFAYRWNEYKRTLITDLQAIAKNRIVCIENMKDFVGYFVPILSPSELLEFAKETGISVTIDTTHLAQCNIDIAPAAAMLNSVVKTIHLSDYHDGQAHVFIGEGDLNLVSFYKELDLSKLYMTTIECNIPYETDDEQFSIEKCRHLKEYVQNLILM